jgi:hypothetical protein
MRHPAFLTLPRQILFLSACILTGLALTLCESGLVSVSAGILFLDSLIYAVLFGLLAFLLWFVVYFADLSFGQPFQRILNHVALMVLLLLAWVGGGYLLELFFKPEVRVELSRSIPLKLVLGLLVFLLVIRLYTDWKREKDCADDFDSEDNLALPGFSQTNVGQSSANQAAETDSASANSSKNGHLIGALDKISVKTGQKINMIPVADILFLQADGDYVLIHTPVGRFLKEQTMKYFEDNLSHEQFVRIHRSCIVQIGYISRIELYEKQNYRITLKTGQQLKTSLAGYRLLKQVLNL